MSDLIRHICRCLGARIRKAERKSSENGAGNGQNTHDRKCFCSGTCTISGVDAGEISNSASAENVRGGEGEGEGRERGIEGSEGEVDILVQEKQEKRRK